MRAKRAKALRRLATAEAIENAPKALLPDSEVVRRLVQVPEGMDSHGNPTHHSTHVITQRKRGIARRLYQECKTALSESRRGAR